MNYTTPKAMKPANYREYLAHCAANAINPLPAHSVTPNGCWRLLKPLAPNTNGHIAIKRRVNGKQYSLQLHTLSLLHSQAPSVWRDIDDIQVDGARAMACHKPICHEPNGAGRACFNPSHLRLDGDAGNARDRQRDGNNPAGARNGQSKLTAAQVNDIRREAEAGSTHAAIARKYGVSRPAISQIVKRKRWAQSDGRLL